MTARVVLFTGPTLSAGEVAERAPGVTCAPPVSQGDVYRACAGHPSLIAIVDGYFESVPAVWHKEILWALSRGIHVFGAASMGALRAAELAAFGMVGVGRIFEAFRDGTLGDDDEVAVRHASAEHGFRAVSEAMVNIRATLERAVRAGVVSGDAADILIRGAKDLFYAHRTYETVLEAGRAAGIPEDELTRLIEWLPEGRTDQKRLDALELLDRIAAFIASDPGPLLPAFHFEHTDMWEQVGRRGPLDRTPQAMNAEDGDGSWYDEARLFGPDRYAAMRDRAVARAVGLEEARRQGVTPAPEQVAEQAVRFRRRTGLDADDRFAAWLRREGLTRGAFDAAMADDVRLEQVRALFEPDITRAMAAVLREDGLLESLRSRAETKRDVLVRHGVARTTLAESGMTAASLFVWYFNEVLGAPAPGDLVAVATSFGCPDHDALVQLLLGEWWFRRLTDEQVAERPAT